jgi:hypothetical protein
LEVLIALSVLSFSSISKCQISIIAEAVGTREEAADEVGEVVVVAEEAVEVVEVVMDSFSNMEEEMVAIVMVEVAVVVERHRLYLKLAGFI